MNNITPGFIALLGLLSIAIFAVRIDRLIVPIVIAMCFLPADISLKIGTLDFQAIRILAIFGLLRVYLNGNEKKIQFNTIDKYFFLYNILGSIAYFIASENKTGAFLYKSGVFIDSIVLYIVLRHSVQTHANIKTIVKTFSFCVLALSPFILYEYFTADNPFSFLGRSHISLRDGLVRARGTFSHSILFGSFAAALIPILWADYKIQKSTLKLISLLICFFFIFSCTSSGPIVALAGVLALIAFFKWKHHFSSLVGLVLFVSIFIHFFREKPIWHLIYVRISLNASSTGWHRYMLVEAAIKEFWNWWLIGYGDIGPAWHLLYWPANHAKFTDMTNHYLLEGVRGGFFTMFFFIMLCYKSITTLASFSIVKDEITDQWLWWGFTVMMVSHCITFLSVAYFGQITMLLYLTFAISAFALDEMNRNKLA